MKRWTDGKERAAVRGAVAIATVGGMTSFGSGASEVTPTVWIMPVTSRLLR